MQIDRKGGLDAGKLVVVADLLHHLPAQKCGRAPTGMDALRSTEAVAPAWPPTSRSVY